MSPPPEGTNELDNPDLFKERLLYKQRSFIEPNDTDYTAVPLDMIYEKPFYGKVDIYGNTVYPSEYNMKQLPGPALVMVHDFVAFHFNLLKSFLMPTLISKERLLADMFGGYVPKVGTRNFHQLYQKHFKNKIYKVFANDYITRPDVNRKIKSFKNFVNEFVNWSALMRDHFPITKTAFIMSPLCPNTISGLIITLDNKAADDDGIKYESFISDSCFKKYVNVVSAHGFYVDKNVPWRIAANLDHKSWNKTYSVMGTSLNQNHLFSEYFYKSEYRSYESIKARLWNMYMMLLTDPDSWSWGTQYEANNCIRAMWDHTANHKYKTVATRQARKPVSDDYWGKFQEEYPDSFFLPAYLKIRMVESRRSWSAGTFRSKLKKVLNIYKHKGVEAACEVIGKMTKQSEIYVPGKHKGNKRIKYFGNSVSSGLHSYISRDMITVDLDKRAELLSDEEELMIYDESS